MSHPSDPGHPDSPAPTRPSGPRGRKPAIFRRLLLLVLPRSFRRRNGDEILLFWEMQATEARYKGRPGPLRLALSLTLDAIRFGIRIRGNRLLNALRSLAGSPPPPSGEPMLKSFSADLRYALRSVRGAPLFSGVVVLTLALGIGATTAAWSVVEEVVLRPLPYPEPDRLVRVLRTLEEGKSRTLSWPDFRDYRESAGEYLALTAHYEMQGTFPWEGGAESLDGAGVSREFFSVMGVEPLLGRSFTPEEDAAGGPTAVVLSFAFWNRYLEGDPDVLSRTVPMGQDQVPVVGVMPEGFSFPLRECWFWVPLRDDELLAEVGLPTGTRTLNFLDVLGRVAPGVSAEEAELRLRTLASTVDQESGKPQEIHTDIHFLSLQESLVGELDTTLFFLLGAAGLVLLVASANVAGLAFSRATSRERELAVRSALGAGQPRLLRQLLSENLLLSLLGGAAGVGVAWAVQQGLLRLAPPAAPELEGLSLTPLTLLFVGSVTVASGLLFGFVPALRASRTEIGPALAGGRGASAGRRALRPQQLLVTLQVTLAVVLLVAATLLTTSFIRLNGVNRGFVAESVLVATVDPDTDHYDTPQAVDLFYRSLLDRIRALPGVQAASTTYSPPLMGNGFRTSVLPEGMDRETTDPFWASTVVARDGYFEANGIPLLQGRDFRPGDGLDQTPVAIVSQSMAETLWPGEDPLGKRFRFAGGLGGSAESFDPAFFPPEGYTVVGVAGDVRRESLNQDPGLEYYRPHSQTTWAFQYLVVRAQGDPTGVASRIRDTVWEVDPQVPVRTIRTLDAQLRESLALERFQTTLLVAFGLVTAFLSMVGLYAVMTLAVARRSREMGIRLALGAPAVRILRGVLRQGMALVAVGIGLGLILSLALGGTIAGMLYQIQPGHPGTYLLVTLLVSGVAGVACYLPARRAARVDPLRTLQEE